MQDWKIYLTAGAALLALTLPINGSAQNNNYDRRSALVTIYEGCDYSGTSRSIDAGDYRNISSLGFGNDQMSSIKVPQGLEVTIFEHEKFKGDYARITQDIACFDRNWNDAVSSLQITSTGRLSNQADERDARSNDSRRSNANNRRATNADRNVTGDNVARVAFGTSVLQQTGKKHWNLNDPREGVSQFKETQRNESTVYLQNQYTAERVRIDLFANDVTFSDRDGRSQRYSISAKQAAVATNSQEQQADRIANNQSSQNRTIRSECFNFRAYTEGGNGGLRFHGKNDFYRFSKKAESARICHNGPLTMEVSKTAPNTQVVVEIAGNRYIFASNEKHDALKNNWYRKFVKLKVGR